MISPQSWHLTSNCVESPWTLHTSQYNVCVLSHDGQDSWLTRWFSETALTIQLLPLPWFSLFSVSKCQWLAFVEGCPLVISIFNRSTWTWTGADAGGGLLNIIHKQFFLFVLYPCWLMIKTLEIIQILDKIVWEFQTPKHKTDENEVLLLVTSPLTNSQVAQNGPD